MFEVYNLMFSGGGELMKKDFKGDFRDMKRSNEDMKSLHEVIMGDWDLILNYTGAENTGYS